MPAETTPSPERDAERQLAAFIDRFAPADQQLIRSVRTAVRKRFVTCNELVYDYSRFIVIGYSPTERPTDAVVAIRAREKSVSLCFLQGARLPDPAGILRGSGNQTRSTTLASAKELERCEIEALIAAAIARAPALVPVRGRGKLIIRSKPAIPRSMRRA